MALKALNSVVAANYQIKKDMVIHAGDVVAFRTDGTIGVASRDTGAGYGTTTINVVSRFQVLGIAAEDRAVSGNTFINFDPSGSSYGVGSTILAYNNGAYVGARRALGDFQDESISVVTNLTAGADTTGLTQRGISVYTTPSSQFITDRYRAVQTSSAFADNTSAYTFLPGDLLTVGALSQSNQGYLVGLSNTGYGPIVGRVDSYDAAGGLLYFTLV